MITQIKLPIFTTQTAQDLIATAQQIARDKCWDIPDENSLDEALLVIIEYDGRHERRGLRIGVGESGGYDLMVEVDHEEDLQDLIENLAEMVDNAAPDTLETEDLLAWHVAHLLKEGWEMLECGMFLNLPVRSGHARVQSFSQFQAIQSA